MSYEPPRFDPFGASNYNAIYNTPDSSYKGAKGFLIRKHPMTKEEAVKARRDIIAEFEADDKTFSELERIQKITRKTLDTMIGISDTGSVTTEELKRNPAKMREEVSRVVRETEERFKGLRQRGPRSGNLFAVMGPYLTK